MKNKNKVIGIILVAILGMTILFFTNVNFAANTAVVNVETANLREEANENSRILKQLSLNDNVEVLESADNWCKVKVNGITGYLRQDLITREGTTSENATSNETSKPTENEPTTQEPVDNNVANEEKIVLENTKLKIVPSINATDIVEVKKDEKVVVIETMNDWVCVQTNNTKGWIRKEKLADKTTVQEQKTEEVKPIKTAYIKETKVNVRKEANQYSEVVVKLKQNTSVDVYSEENGWSKVKVDGKEGYILSELLSDKKIEKQTENKTTSRSSVTTRKENKSTKQTSNKQNTTATTNVVSGKGATVVETAKKYIGYKYVYGASGPNSFDCSGFTSYVFRLHGVSLNRTAKGQYSNGTAVSRSNLQPGDLVMFGPSVSGINHVGIYIGGGKMVHAANPSRGVTIDSINSGYYNKNYVGARRVI